MNNLKAFWKEHGLKCLAALLSLLACLAVHVFRGPVKTEEIVAHRVFTIPINVIPPTNDLIHTTNTKEVVVTLKGPLIVLDRITPNLLSAEINLSGRNQPGNNLESINIMAPGGVTVSEVDPSYTWVKISKKMVKRVPVSVALQGQVESGYSVGEPEIAPENIRIIGDQDSVEQVVSMRAPLAISHAKNTFSAVVNTILPVDENGQQVQNVTAEDQNISVTIPIYALTRIPVDIKNVKVKINGKKKPPYAISVNPESILVESINKNELPQKISVHSCQIPFSGEEITRSIPLDIPDNVSLSSGESHNVTVKIFPLRSTSGKAEGELTKTVKKSTEKR